MRFVLLVALLLAPLVQAEDDWGALHYLIGNWVGEGSGGPGVGSGSFSFEPDLKGTILVRKNRAEYPATKDRQAYTHDDLMIIFRDPSDNAEGAMRAIYFDNEGHVIRYAVAMFGDRIVFTSEPSRTAPQYRFTYTRDGADKVAIKFEIAPPGKGFSTYIEASAKRAR